VNYLILLQNMAAGRFWDEDNADVACEERLLHSHGLAAATADVALPNTDLIVTRFGVEANLTTILPLSHEIIAPFTYRVVNLPRRTVVNLPLTAVPDPSA
jgi:hypothetical protein